MRETIDQQVWVNKTTYLVQRLVVPPPAKKVDYYVTYFYFYQIEKRKANTLCAGDNEIDEETASVGSSNRSKGLT